MKRLSKYLKDNRSSLTSLCEELDSRTIENLTVTYKTENDDTYINCPETFQEDDIRQYIDDLLLEQMPSNQDIAKKYFAANVKYINDAYFEYDKFVRLDYKKSTVDIDYDDTLGKDVSDDTKIVTFKITNLRFIMLFAKFELNLTNDNVQETLDTIFSAYESNDYNDSDVQFIYDSCEFDE